MYWILYGLYVLSGLIGCALGCFADHMDENIGYYKKYTERWKPFRLSRRGAFVFILASLILGFVVFLMGLLIFLVSWINTDWTGFWSKPVCNCFEPKKEKSNV